MFLYLTTILPALFGGTGLLDGEPGVGGGVVPGGAASGSTPPATTPAQPPAAQPGAAAPAAAPAAADPLAEFKARYPGVEFPQGWKPQVAFTKTLAALPDPDRAAMLEVMSFNIAKARKALAGKPGDDPQLRQQYQQLQTQYQELQEKLGKIQPVELPEEITSLPEGPERDAAEKAYIAGERARTKSLAPFQEFMRQATAGQQTQQEEAQIKALVAEAAEIAPLAIPSTLTALATIHAMSAKDGDEPIDITDLALKAQNQTLSAFESALAAEQPAVIELVLAAIPKLLEKKSPAIARLQQLFLNAEAAARGGGGPAPAPKPIDPKRGKPSYDDYRSGRANADGTWKD